MSNWDFPGAKWWKFDFHTHTPASLDFGRPELTCEDWLREHMKKGIDCVAVTDHNSGEWIDQLKHALVELTDQGPEWYRPLHLFPGVEISANGDVHVLAIFDPEKSTSDIDSLLGAVGYGGTKGSSDGVTTKSLTEVIDSVVQVGGIAIPAHVDREKGLFSIQAQSLRQVLENSNIYAMELCDENFSKHELYTSTKTDWTEVCGSDFHGIPTDIFTWVKMGPPCIEGLRLALIDGTASVNRDMEAEPNRHAEYVIENIKVEKAKYMGRPEALTCQLSPFLNTIIGGRGSGKSTLLEFMRLALRREQELPPRLKKDYQGYFSADENGLLTQSSLLRLVYRKGNTRYRLNWDANVENFETPSLEVQEETGEWRDTDGEIASLFPVSIYSQKQIFELASEPQGLLGIIDRAPEVGFEEFRGAYLDCLNICKQLHQRRVQLLQNISEENRLKGELNDIIRQIQQVEKSGHKDALRNYRLRQQQLNEIEYVERYWMRNLYSLRPEFDEAEAATVDESIFAQHPEILTALQSKQDQWRQQIDQINRIVEKQTEDLEQWKVEKHSQPWMKALNRDLQRYEELRAQLEQQGIDPQVYPDLLQKRSLLIRKLQKIAEYKEQAKKLEDQCWEKVYEAIRYRDELTERRKWFLHGVLEDNKLVQIRIEPFAEPWTDKEKTLREILQVGDRFDRDFEFLKETVENEKNGWEQAKQWIFDIRDGEKTAKDFRFRNHLKKLPNESFINLRLWFPEDALQITYGKTGKKIRRGSPGQKSAALLTFILAYGNKPLLLDQPEDDLDSELIYSLIVQAIKDSKTKRQDYCGYTQCQYRGQRRFRNGAQFERGERTIAPDI